MTRALSRWFGDGDVDDARTGLRTRRADKIADLKFDQTDAPAKADQKAARVRQRQPAKSEIR